MPFCGVHSSETIAGTNPHYIADVSLAARGDEELCWTVNLEPVVPWWPGTDGYRTMDIFAGSGLTKMHKSAQRGGDGFLNTWKTPDDVASSGAQSVHKIAQGGRNSREPGTLPERSRRRRNPLQTREEGPGGGAGTEGTFPAIRSSLASVRAGGRCRSRFLARTRLRATVAQAFVQAFVQAVSKVVSTPLPGFDTVSEANVGMTADAAGRTACATTQHQSPCEKLRCGPRRACWPARRLLHLDGEESAHVLPQ
jgi:hypothetical protein